MSLYKTAGKPKIAVGKVNQDEFTIPKQSTESDVVQNTQNMEYEDEIPDFDQDSDDDENSDSDSESSCDSVVKKDVSKFKDEDLKNPVDDAEIHPKSKENLPNKNIKRKADDDDSEERNVTSSKCAKVQIDLTVANKMSENKSLHIITMEDLDSTDDEDDKDQENSIADSKLLQAAAIKKQDEPNWLDRLREQHKKNQMSKLGNNNVDKVNIDIGIINPDQETSEDPDIIGDKLVSTDKAEYSEQVTVEQNDTIDPIFIL